MSKTIDVRDGDTWTLHDCAALCQHRNGEWRVVVFDSVHGDLYWNRSPDPQPDEIDISPKHAKSLLLSWGYTLTPAAKPEAKPTPPTVKENLTTDVPVVDAVWVEVTWPDGKNYLSPRADLHRSLDYIEIIKQSKGTARIVRIRPDAEAIKAVVREMLENYSATDHNARAFIRDLQVQVKNLESRLAALEKPADKPAARVVKAPKMSGVFSGSAAHKWMSIRDNEWREALASQGITVEAAE